MPLKRPTSRLARELLIALDVPYGAATVERYAEPARFVVLLAASAWRRDLPIRWRGYPVEYQPPPRRRARRK